MDNRIFSLVSGCTLTNSDIRQMAKIYVVAFSKEPWNEVWSESDARDELMKSIHAAGEFSLCRIDEVIAGFGIAKVLCPDQCEDHQTLVSLGLQPNSYYIGELVTHHEYRKKGIASGIINTLFQHACRSNYSEISLRTKHTNRALFGILNRWGFRRIAEYEVSTGGVVSTRVVFSLPLLQDWKDACENWIF